MGRIFEFLLLEALTEGRSPVATTHAFGSGLSGRRRFNRISMSSGTFGINMRCVTFFDSLLVVLFERKQ